MEVLKVKFTVSIVIVVCGLVFGFYRDYRGRIWGTAGVTSGDITRSYSTCLRNCESPGMTSRTVEYNVASTPITQTFVYEDGGKIEHNIGVTGDMPVIPGVAKVEVSAVTPLYSVNPSDVLSVLNRSRSGSIGKGAKDVNKTYVSNLDWTSLVRKSKKHNLSNFNQLRANSAKLDADIKVSALSSKYRLPTQFTFPTR